MTFAVGDVVQFAHWTDRLAALSGNEERKCRGGMNLFYRIVARAPDGRFVVRRRDIVGWSGESFELTLEAASLDLIGGRDCGADLRADLIGNARVYLQLALESCDYPEAVVKYEAFEAFIHSAPLTAREREIFDATNKYKLLLEAIVSEATWSEIFSLFSKESGEPPFDLKGNVALALHHRALKERKHLDDALGKILEVQENLAGLHAHHPLRRFSLPTALDDAASKLRATIAAFG